MNIRLNNPAFASKSVKVLSILFGIYLLYLAFSETDWEQASQLQTVSVIAIGIVTPILFTLQNKFRILKLIGWIILSWYYVVIIGLQ
ncbi:hypothetical protein [Gayadomonas joobiniege]|uniref:hypothetical protein n=1 Tax=Gayadomonas joobiniege TaxID=1234606 RepID=UPI00036B833E|nr:hypothetical protein [Gayadomonas joobiniege]